MNLTQDQKVKLIKAFLYKPISALLHEIIFEQYSCTRDTLIVIDMANYNMTYLNLPPGAKPYDGYIELFRYSGSCIYDEDFSDEELFTKEEIQILDSNVADPHYEYEDMYEAKSKRDRYLQAWFNREYNSINSITDRMMSALLVAMYGPPVNDPPMF